MQNIVLAVLGRKGTGKTTWVKSKLIPRWSRVKPVYIVDLHGEYEDIPRKGKKIFPIQPEDSDKELQLIWACWKRGGWAIIIEEADRWTRGGHLNRTIRNVIWYARNHRIDLALIAKNPSALGLDVLRQADYAVVFPFRELGADIDIAKRLGIIPPKQPFKPKIYKL